MEKEHFEILLEDINRKFDIVIEGHTALDKKIDDRFNELKEEIKENTFAIGVLSKRIDDVEESLGKKLDAVAADLSAHRADTEAHHGVYRVKETEEQYPK